MQYANPNTEGAVISFKERYENFIGGAWVAPVNGDADNISEVNGKPFCQIRALVRKTLNWHWMPHTPPRMRGAELP